MSFLDLKINKSGLPNLEGVLRSLQGINILIFREITSLTIPLPLLDVVIAPIDPHHHFEGPFQVKIGREVLKIGGVVDEAAVLALQRALRGDCGDDAVQTDAVAAVEDAGQVGMEVEGDGAELAV